MNTKLISIIVPVYKVEKSIEKCLQSIRQQTYEHIEIICVNDGSPDNSEGIIKKMMADDRRIRLINKANGGLSSARNEGVKFAQGEFIAFVDSDDYIQENMIERMSKTIVESDCDIVCCGTNIIYESFSYLKQGDERYFSISEALGVKVTTEQMVSLNVCAWNKMYKTSIIKKYGLEFPEGLYYEDAPYLWMYLIHADRISFISDKLYNYIRHEQSIMGTTYYKKSRRALDHIYLMYPVWDHINKFNISQEYQTAILVNSLKYVFIAFKNLPLRFKLDSIWEMIKLVNYIASLQNFFMKKPRIIKIYSFWFFTIIQKIVERLFERI